MTPGQRIGVYEVVAPIGAGGMGEVYRAQDTRLNRDVAIKILPHALASAPDHLARFEREARALASLNHPNIATIHGVEDADGVRALIMELVPGDTLAERIARTKPGGLPLAEALGAARQIADALDAAHEKGIVHRDLKPANIKITPDGLVKVLDFGLAKQQPAEGIPDASQALTAALGGTREGMVVGTAAYMSPEQARGQAVDKRTDIWAFGCVLYEMLTGRAPFARQTLTDTLAAVIEREPDWSPLAASTPTAVRRLLRRCLTKDPKRRLRDIGDARLELIEPSSDTPSAPDKWRPGRLLAYLGWATAVLMLVGLIAERRLDRGTSSSAAARVTRTLVMLPPDQQLASGDTALPMALSPDGSTIAYVSEKDGRTLLHVRALAALEPREIPGSSGARHPFFSPDGRWVGFFAGGALQKVAVDGGAPLPIVDVDGFTVGATWAPDDTIIFARRGRNLTKIKASGGTLQEIPGANPAVWPQVLPDGKRVLFTTGADGATNAIAVMTLDGLDKRIVARMADARLEGPSVLGSGGNIVQARVVSSGFLVYGQSPGIVRALPIDGSTLTPTGSSISLVDSIEQARNGGGVYFAVSADGLMVYASTGDRHQLVWVDRQGNVTPISADRAAFRHPRLSPDGTRIAVGINDETRRSDIWIYDAARGSKIRLTTSSHNLSPVWSPDGSRVTFSSRGLVEEPVDGHGAGTSIFSAEHSRALLATGTSPYPTSWSADGRRLLFQADERDLWALERGEPATARALRAGPANDYQGVFSPNGQWVAYVSDETGQSEVYVGRWPDLSGRITVSTSGGTLPRWSRDGRELFYRQGDGVMSVAIETTPTLKAQAPRRLFAGRFVGAGREEGFDVTGDGRFVMVKSDERSVLQQLTVVQNWFSSLKASH